jgi:hypothetical protein
MSKLIKCPDCGKLIATRFPLHECKPKSDIKCQFPGCNGTGQTHMEPSLCKFHELAIRAIGVARKRGPVDLGEINFSLARFNMFLTTKNLEEVISYLETP